MSTIEFSTDWDVVRPYWPQLFADHELTGKPGLRFLEIGCFEGQATLWLLENVLTDPSSRITVVDTFQGSPEFEAMGVDASDIYGRFRANLGNHTDRISICKGRSGDVLRALEGPFDFVYVDGSHMAADVLQDAVLAWPLLESGGLLCFDDYAWGLQLPIHERPKAGVDAFVNVYRRELSLVHTRYQFVVRKR